MREITWLLFPFAQGLLNIETINQYICGKHKRIEPLEIDLQLESVRLSDENAPVEDNNRNKEMRPQKIAGPADEKDKSSSSTYDTSEMWEDFDVKSVFSVATSNSYRSKLYSIALENGNVEGRMNKLKPKLTDNQPSLRVGGPPGTKTISRRVTCCGVTNNIRANPLPNTGARIFTVDGKKRCLKKSSSEARFFLKSKGIFTPSTKSRTSVSES